MIAWLAIPRPCDAVTVDWQRVPADGSTPTGWRFGSAAVWWSDEARSLSYGGAWYEHLPGAGYHDILLPEVLSSDFSLANVFLSERVIEDGPDSPTGVNESAMALDATTGRLFIFGGIRPTFFGAGQPPEYSGALSVAGLWDAPPAWSTLLPAGSGPVARRGATLLVDAPRGRLLLFGGRDAAGSDLGDLWSCPLDGTPGWTQLDPSGAPPGPRVRAMMWLDPHRDRILLAGGEHAGTPLGDAWVLAVAPSLVWSGVPVSGTPPAGIAHAWTRDEARDQLVVFSAGAVESVSVLDRIASDVLEWRHAAPSGASPPALEPTTVPALDPALAPVTAAVFDPVRRRAVLLFGEAVPYDDGGVVRYRGVHWAAIVRDDPIAEAPAGSVSLRLAPPSPNPTRANLHAALTLPDDQPGELNVLDVSGRRVFGRRVEGAGAHELVVSVSALPPGVYLLQVRHPAGTRTTRFLRIP